MNLLQGPTGVHRSIMVKATAETGYSQRTPSVWLLPESNHFTIRVSTEVNADTGENHFI
jgi:hypothetical protein